MDDKRELFGSHPPVIKEKYMGGGAYANTVHVFICTGAELGPIMDKSQRPVGMWDPG